MKQKKLLSNIFISLIFFAFITGNVYAAQNVVDLGTAGDFVILAKSGISTTGTTSIVGDIGVSPIAATAITGFGLIMDSSNQFATSSLVTGKIYAADYAPSTPTRMTSAVSDMETAYTDAAGRTLPDYTELGAGNIGGMTLKPGLYKWGTGVTIPTDVTLSGSSTDVWIFQIAQTLDISNGKQVILSGGAQAKNIFWQVAGQATLGTTSVFNGNILGQTAIVLNTGATLNGRALAQTAVTLDAVNVSLPGGPSPNIDEVTFPSPSPTSNPTTTPAPAPIVKPSITATRTGNTIEVTSVDAGTGMPKNIKIEAEIPVEVKENTIRVTQSTGAMVEVKVMPATASATGIASLKIKACSAENNCTIKLKEVSVNGVARAAYSVSAEKEFRIFGLINAKSIVSANIDAETGAVVSVIKPWWAFIAVEVN